MKTEWMKEILTSIGALALIFASYLFVAFVGGI